MAQAARIFVSHSHEKNAWCREFVAALRQAGVDVWYDEHNMGYGALEAEIERELRARPIFIVVHSPASVGKPWVRREVSAAISLQDEQPGRVIHALALALAPASAPVAPAPPAATETAEQAWERGKGLRAQGRHEEALAAYERAITLDPNNALYWNGTGAALRARLADARTHCTLAPHPRA